MLSTTNVIRSLMVVAMASTGCARCVPEPPGVVPGTPHISWVIMSGTRDDPDQDFACQSDPRSECVVPASRPNAPTFSDVHVYYHGTSAETKYTGSFQVGFYDGPPEPHRVQTNTTVKKNESIINQSVTDIVTSTAGTYTVTFDLMATVTATGKTEPIRDQIRVVVK